MIGVHGVSPVIHEVQWPNQEAELFRPHLVCLELRVPVTRLRPLDLLRWRPGPSKEQDQSRRTKQQKENHQI